MGNQGSLPRSFQVIFVEVKMPIIWRQTGTYVHYWISLCGPVLISPVCRWWNVRDSILAIPETRSNRISVNLRQDKKLLSKAVVGRGPKRTHWVEWLHKLLLQEFDRLRKAGVKFSPKLLLRLAYDIVRTSEHPECKYWVELEDNWRSPHIPLGSAIYACKQHCWPQPDRKTDGQPRKDPANLETNCLSPGKFFS